MLAGVCYAVALRCGYVDGCILRWLEDDCRLANGNFMEGSWL